jgi:hypothetical protein
MAPNIDREADKVGAVEIDFNDFVSLVRKRDVERWERSRRKRALSNAESKLQSGVSSLGGGHHRSENQ